MSTTDQIVLWVIDRDYLNGPGDDFNRVGYGQTLDLSQATNDSHEAVIGRTVYVDASLKSSAIPEWARVRFRCLDDDDETYYGGVCDARALDLSQGLCFPPEDGDEEADYAYNIDRWATADAGAVHTLFKRSDLIRVAEHVNAEKVKAWAEKHPGAHADQGGDDWLPIYG